VSNRVVPRLVSSVRCKYCGVRVMPTSALVEDEEVPLLRAHVRDCRPDLGDAAGVAVIRHFVIVLRPTA
jgi:hypothetical protein